MGKDILRIGRERLIRMWVTVRNTPKTKDSWIELGHFMAGFDLKLTSIKETDGLKRESRAAVMATGTFEAAQNSIADYQQYTGLLNGPLGVMILFGNPQWPDRGKLLVLNWSKNSDNSWSDQRVAIVADPVYNTMLKAAGTISGFLPAYDLYKVNGVQMTGAAVKYTVLETLRTPSLPAFPFNNIGS